MGIFAAKGATTVCFPSGTKVHAEKGLVNIEDLNVGDNAYITSKLKDLNTNLYL
jgi:hypothetical protein